MSTKRENDDRPAFRVSARTILQLGGELISSDGVAFYELIKNAVDADSPEVTVEVTVRLPFDNIEQARTEIAAARGRKDAASAVTRILVGLTEHVVSTAPGAKDLLAAFSEVATADEAESLLDEANTIRFIDTGHGMDLKELKKVYLRIGTPVRLLERRSDTNKVILGEKGIGRLSVMRLGHKLLVETTRTGDKRLNLLRIDWRDFDRDLDQMLEDVHVAPEAGERKEDVDQSGTTIRVSALRTAWSEDRLRALATTDLSRATDPFANKPAVPINIRFNGIPVLIDRLNELLFEHCHAIVTFEMKMRSARGPILTGEIDYRHHKRKQAIRLELNDLYEAAGVTRPELLERLGPFTVRFYWYNRQLLDPIEGIGNVKQVRQLIAQWSGGLMVYRDGFRVPPYGSPEDDWLDLDRTSLSYKSHKVNRAQLIGKVDITSRGNPYLRDQTNREGLADCPEKAALVTLLQNILGDQFRPFLDRVDDEISIQNAPSLDELETRFEDQQETLQTNVATLRRYASENPDAGLKPLVERFAEQAGQLRELVKQTKAIKENTDRKEDRLMNLAGLGLMVEILAHELNRSVVHSIRGLGSAISASEDGRLTSLLESAEAQLRSLQKRISVLDRLSTSGRQRSETFNPAETVQEVFDGRSEQFETVGITAKVETSPAKGSLQIKMVKGMFYQIIENLVENSVYWLRSEKELNKGFRPAINVRIDTASQSLFFTDNGPGIDPVNADQIFVAFFSLKKKGPGQGKGLGLYVSREYAKDQRLELTLSSKSTRSDGRLNTFILNLAGAVKG